MTFKEYCEKLDNEVKAKKEELERDKFDLKISVLTAKGKVDEIFESITKSPQRFYSFTQYAIISLACIVPTPLSEETYPLPTNIDTQKLTRFIFYCNEVLNNCVLTYVKTAVGTNEITSFHFFTKERKKSGADLREYIIGVAEECNHTLSPGEIEIQIVPTTQDTYIMYRSELSSHQEEHDCLRDIINLFTNL